MTNWITKEFIDYCWAHWLKKKEARIFVKLFSEYVTSSILINWRFNLFWFWTFNMVDFKSNLKWWQIFKKIKFTPSEKIKSLTYIKKW